jgi:hypothetical protein
MKLEMEITCGTTTCYNKEKAEMCEFVGSVRMGTEWVCMLFPSEEGSQTKLSDVSGFLQRCDKCKECSI